MAGLIMDTLFAAISIIGVILYTGLTAAAIIASLITISTIFTIPAYSFIAIMTMITALIPFMVYSIEAVVASSSRDSSVFDTAMDAANSVATAVADAVEGEGEDEDERGGEIDTGSLAPQVPDTLDASSNTSTAGLPSQLLIALSAILSVSLLPILHSSTVSTGFPSTDVLPLLAVTSIFLLTLLCDRTSHALPVTHPAAAILAISAITILHGIYGSIQSNSNHLNNTVLAIGAIVGVTFATGTAQCAAFFERNNFEGVVRKENEMGGKALFRTGVMAGLLSGVTTAALWWLVKLCQRW